MAFECENVLTITGNGSDLQLFKNKAQAEDIILSIAKLHEMPAGNDADTWCQTHFGLPDNLEAEVDEDDNFVAYWFWTEDVPPYKWLRQVSIIFPMLHFESLYWDPNNGKGSLHVQNGKLIEFVEHVDD